MPHWLRWTLRIGIPFVLLVIVLAWVFWPREHDLRRAIIDTYGIGREDLLFMNVPPLPDRYPGTLLLPLEGIYAAYSTIASGDADLNRGAAAGVEGAYRDLGRADSSLVAAVFKQVVKAKKDVRLDFAIVDSRTVEMLAPRILDRYPAFESENDLDKLVVILRAYEGKMRIGIQRESTMSVEAWADLKDVLEGVANAEANVQIARESEEKIRITIDEPFVFAYLAANAKEFKHQIPMAAMNAPPPSDSRTDVRNAVEAMIEFDPLRLPEPSKTLRDLGPEAIPVIEATIQRADPVERDRAIYMLRFVEPPERVATVDPGRLIASPDVLDRVWGIRRLAEGGQAALPQLRDWATRESADPAVRLMALQSLARLDVDPTLLRSAFEGALNANDESVRAGAIHALEALPVEARPQRDRVEAAARTIRDPRLERTTANTLRRIHP